MDFLTIVLWWFYILLIGIAFLPISTLLFPRFYDKGYLFSKTLGIAVVSYSVWLMASLKLVPFSKTTIILILIFFAAILFGLIFRNKKVHEAFKSRGFIKAIVYEEILFFVCIAFWSFLRGLKPEIEGLEKFMDLGFVNSIINSNYMPPIDMWFAGEYINYYYYGHYITAFLTKLSGISSYETYNLMMSTLFAFAFVLPFSIVSNLVSLIKKATMRISIIGGLVSSLLISLGGNLHVIVFGYIVPTMQKWGFKFSENLTIRDNYWFPDATRYIGHNPDVGDRTIHEFPLYSFVVSDLHAHVINIPFVLTFIALTFAFLLSIFNTKKVEDSTIKKSYPIVSLYLFLLAFLIGLFQMTNYWDFPIYVTVLLITVFYIYFTKYGLKAITFLNTAITGFGVIIVAMLISYPFSSNFDNLFSGIKLTPTHSALYQLIIVWGQFLFFIIWFIVFILKGKDIQPSYKKSKIVVKQNLQDKLVYRLKNIQIPDIFILILSISALGLLIIPEIIYVNDIYSEPHHRSNTVFKLTYQSFIMFGLASGFIFARIFMYTKSGKKNVLIKILAILFIILPMIYPFYAIKSWYGELQLNRYQQLDGMTFLEEKYPGDYEAVIWLNENVANNTPVLEANGDSYTLYGRISMSTGLPTILGWYTHEWLWRNDNGIVSKRVEEVKIVYESDDIENTKMIIEKYGIEYIIIGPLEKEKFQNINQDKIINLGEKVFESNGTQIIKVNYND